MQSTRNVERQPKIYNWHNRYLEHNSWQDQLQFLQLLPNEKRKIPSTRIVIQHDSTHNARLLGVNYTLQSMNEA